MIIKYIICVLNNASCIFMKQQNKFLLLMFKYVRSSKHCIVHQNVTLIKMESHHIFPYLAVEHGAPSNTRTLLSLIYYGNRNFKKNYSVDIYCNFRGEKMHFDDLLLPSIAIL